MTALALWIGSDVATKSDLVTLLIVIVALWVLGLIFTADAIDEVRKSK